GYAKRTRLEEYPIQGRGGKGVLTARIVSTRGGLVGALAVRPEDEVYAITSNGGVIRTSRDSRMSEPRYPTRVSDPDETARIPKDALDALRDADQSGDGKASGHPT